MTKLSKDQALGDHARLRRSPVAVASLQKALQDLGQGRHAAASAGLRKLIQQFPGVPQLWVNLGLAAAGTLDSAGARASFSTRDGVGTERFRFAQFCRP